MIVAPYSASQCFSVKLPNSAVKNSTVFEAHTPMKKRMVDRRGIHVLLGGAVRVDRNQLPYIQQDAAGN